MSDLRFAFRQLLKNTGFAAAAVLTLALGIGANTAIFTVINALLLRSLPLSNPEELMQVVTRSGSSDVNSFSDPFYKMLRDDGHSLSGLFAAGGVGERDQLIVPGAGDAETEFVHGQAVSGNFFSVLGVSAMIGRTLTPADDQDGDPQAVVVISHSFWERRFAANSAVIGKTVDLASALKGTAGTVAGNASGQRLNQALVVTQVALSLVLLVGAGLFIRTLRDLQGVDMGFNRENVVQFDIDFVNRMDSKQRTAL